MFILFTSEINLKLKYLIVLYAHFDVPMYTKEPDVDQSSLKTNSKNHKTKH